MEPQEEIINEFVNGFPGIPPSPKPNWTDIGPTQYPGTSQFTNAGVFLDAPYGTCAFGAFVETYTQPISILLNGNRYTVRTNNWTTTSSVAAHGSISNGVDISKSR
jgi:hypothetical protein